MRGKFMLFRYFKKYHEPYEWEIQALTELYLFPNLPIKIEKELENLIKTLKENSLINKR
jgi:hypothetical protein